eukprot:362467-Chlamydomonas_euryale.AAC.1
MARRRQGAGEKVRAKKKSPQRAGRDGEAPAGRQGEGAMRAQAHVGRPGNPWWGNWKQVCGEKVCGEVCGEKVCGEK